MWIEDASLRAQCTQMLEQAVNGYLNSDQATPSNAASCATTSVEDESDFFNFTSISTLPSQKKHF